MAIIFRDFTTRDAMITETAALLKKHMEMNSDRPHAIMLSGGRTPLPVYEAIRSLQFKASPNLHVMMSDERMTPADSPDNNIHNASAMLSSLRIDENRIIRVSTMLPLEDAAQRFDSDIGSFFARGGHITLALLGLGPDGHTASIFHQSDLIAAREKFAIPVSNIPPFERVSATQGAIRRAETIVFIAAGREKAAVIEKLKSNPASVIAGQVVGNSANVHLWYSP